MARDDLFPMTSRYRGVPIAELTDDRGRTVAYLRRRLLPDPRRFADLQVHTVSGGDRLDNVTARYLGDPEQFWRVCDANNAMYPPDMVAEPGQRLRVPLPQI